MEKTISEKPLTLSWERVPPQRRVWGGTESNLVPPLLPQGIPCPLCFPRVAPLSPGVEGTPESEKRGLMDGKILPFA